MGNSVKYDIIAVQERKGIEKARREVPKGRNSSIKFNYNDTDNDKICISDNNLNSDDIDISDFGVNIINNGNNIQNISY